MAGVKRFHDYLYGHPFELVTDHKLLLGLFAGDHQAPQILSPQLTWWTVFLAAYSYTLTYHPGKYLGHADALSYCPLKNMVEDLAPALPVFLIDSFPFPVTTSDIG